MKKIDVKYVGTLSAAAILLAAATSVIIDLFSGHNMSKLIIMLILFTMVSFFVVFSLAAKVIFKKQIKKHEKKFSLIGFQTTSQFRSNVFYFYVAKEQGEIAVISRWNPFEMQVMSANKVKKAYVDDGKSFTGGTRRVRFCVDIDNYTIKVVTFISRQTYSLKSKEVLTALSKADLQVENIQYAQSAAKRG